MENRKWLKRKYPESFNEINKFLDDERLRQFKQGKYRIGRLTKDVIDMSLNCCYRKGELMYFKGANPVNDYNYPLHPAIFKCGKGKTFSGYESLWTCKEYYNRVVK